ncbi:MAG: hypothetical protein JO304_22380, partial [Solirubrobacterales bacterium]|nr:hypothetical protein [Solirubrobacterales bacterium]
ENKLTPAELESRDRLSAIAEHGVAAYLEVTAALAEIRERQLYRDTHPSYEAYLQDRWGISSPTHEPSSELVVMSDNSSTPAPDRQSRSSAAKPCEALTRACEQTLSALDGKGLVELEVRLAVRKQGDPATVEERENVGWWPIASLVDDELLPKLRWLLTQASGTIADVANQLENSAAEIGDGARAQLMDDVFVVDAELEVVKALVAGPIDWDSDLKRLLDGQIPPADSDGDSDDDE